MSFSTDKIGLACYLMLDGVKLIGLNAKTKGRAIFEFSLTPQDGVTKEMAYTTSDYARFFETFKYLRSRALRGE